MRQATTISIVCLFAMLASIPLQVFGSTPQENAKKYFDAGQYEEAISVWNGLIEAGNITAGTYYNIGLAYAKTGNAPKAIMSFEKALRLKPFNKQIQEAIHQEKARRSNPVIPVQPFFLTEWIKGILSLLRPGYWAVLGLTFFLLVCVMYIKRNSRLPFFGPAFTPKALSIVTAIGAICLLFAFLSYKTIYREDEAIIQVACDIRQAASEESPSRVKVEPGEKVIVLDQIDEWYNIRLVNLEEGWIRKDCFSLIIMGKV